MLKANNIRYIELDIVVSIIFELYGTDLNILQVQEFIVLEFDAEYSTEEIEDYLVVKAKEDISKSSNEFTVEWKELIR